MRSYFRLIVAVAVFAAAFFLFPETPIGNAFALPLIGVALLDEERLSLTEAARRLKVSPSTVWRWTMRGVRGIKLETQVWGAKRSVTEAALEQFREDCTAAANGKSTATQSRTCKQRDRDYQQAERELDLADI